MLTRQQKWYRKKKDTNPEGYKLLLEKQRERGKKYAAKYGKGLRLRFRILLRDNFTCQYCGRKAPDVILNVDHIKPISKGGKTIEVNLKTACLECNSGKSNL